MADARSRPIAPHLADGWRLHWRWGPAMFVSILHRVSGDGMALVGLGVLVWWLVALAGGPASYAAFAAQASAPYGRVVLIGLSWAFYNHMASGLRHFVLDIGAGYELTSNARWSVFSPLLALAATGATWGFILAR